MNSCCNISSNVVATAASTKQAEYTLRDLLAVLIAQASIPNHPFEVEPWPEEARPKIDMPV